jgi:NifU-like protein involved in Fe-S cluster formation
MFQRIRTLARNYHPAVLEHYNNPRNVGSFPKTHPQYMNVGTGLVGAPACGDVMRLQILVNDAGQIIDTKFKVN